MTGLLLDNAAEMLYSRAFKADTRHKTQALIEAQERCFAAGLTTVVEAGLDKRDIDLIDTLQTKGKLKMRVYAMLTANENTLKYYLGTGTYKTPYLDVRSIKLYADGALGSRGALLLKPYEDEPDNSGILVSKPAEMKKICEDAYNNGFQVSTHAIGDSAVRMVLHIYGEVLKEYNGRRWRIEHSQVVDPADLQLYKKYSVIPSIQAVHATSDMNWVKDRLGSERTKHAYINKQLLRQNGWLINGTDFPIENISPLQNFYAAVSRRDLKGEPDKGFQGENALTRMEALRSITIWAARGCFEEREKGSIEPGKLADFIVTDKDIMTIPVFGIPSVKVLNTYINGEKVFGE
jgi:predicted amidohydrolase YtcJ